MVSITDFSSEILLSIFAILKEDNDRSPIQVMGSLSLVCKRFNAVANFEIFRKYTLALRPGPHRALYDKERRSQFVEGWNDTFWDSSRVTARLQHFKAVAHCVRFLTIIDYQEIDPWGVRGNPRTGPDAYPDEVILTIMDALKGATRVIQVTFKANMSSNPFWRTRFPPELWKWVQGQRPNEGIQFWGNFEFSQCVELGPVRGVEELCIIHYNEHTKCLLEVRCRS